MISISDSNSDNVALYGIIEWFCYHQNYEVFDGGPEVIDRALELHQEAGFEYIVWSAGRSVVEYWSAIPGSTRLCELSDQVGGSSWSYTRDIIDHVCPLRKAQAYCKRNGLSLYARLGMNRHYGASNWTGTTSRFALEHPEYREKAISGETDASRLCYHFQEVRDERIQILMELQSLGVDGLVLDFCRQVPMLRYHESLVDVFKQETGQDPTEFTSQNPEDYREWFQFRADRFTDFMRELRAAHRRQEKELGRACPLLARVPDNVPWLCLAYGLDLDRWFEEDLIDATMLSPFPLCHLAPEGDPAYHINLAHRHGKACIAGIGSKNLITSRSFENSGFYRPKALFAMADALLGQGADGLSVYQSESVLRMNYIFQDIADLGSRRTIRSRLNQIGHVSLPDDYLFGVDWHTQPPDRMHGLGKTVGDRAL